MAFNFRAPTPSRRALIPDRQELPATHSEFRLQPSAVQPPTTQRSFGLRCAPRSRYQCHLAGSESRGLEQGPGVVRFGVAGRRHLYHHHGTAVHSDDCGDPLGLKGADLYAFPDRIAGCKPVDSISRVTGCTISISVASLCPTPLPLLRRRTVSQIILPRKRDSMLLPPLCFCPLAIASAPLSWATPAGTP